MYHEDIKKLTKENINYREVLYTGQYSQLVIMSLKKDEEIGEEVHEHVDQLLFIVDGEGEATIGDEVFGFDEHDVIFVPARARHNIKNTGDEELKLYTIYSPPEHEDGLVQETKN